MIFSHCYFVFALAAVTVSAADAQSSDPDPIRLTIDLSEHPAFASASMDPVKIHVDTQPSAPIAVIKYGLQWSFEVKTGMTVTDVSGERTGVVEAFVGDFGKRSFVLPGVSDKEPQFKKGEWPFTWISWYRIRWNDTSGITEYSRFSFVTPEQQTYTQALDKICATDYELSEVETDYLLLLKNTQKRNFLIQL